MGPYGGASESDAASILESIVDCGAESVDEHYNVGKVIGEGRFSKVYAGSSKSSGLAIALKEIDIGTLEEDEEALEMLEAEVLALRRELADAKVEVAHLMGEKEELDHVARRLNKQLAEVGRANRAAS